MYTCTFVKMENTNYDNNDGDDDDDHGDGDDNNDDDDGLDEWTTKVSILHHFAGK